MKARGLMVVAAGTALAFANAALGNDEVAAMKNRYAGGHASHRRRRRYWAERLGKRAYKGSAAAKRASRRGGNPAAYQ